MENPRPQINAEDLPVNGLRDECKVCPHQCEIGSRRIELLAMMADALMQIDGISETILNNLREDGASEASINNMQKSPNFQQVLRKIIAKESDGVNSLSQEETELRKLAEALARNCKGPLNMQATRDGIRYGIGICGSPHLAGGSPTHRHEIAHIRRTTLPPEVAG